MTTISQITTSATTVGDLDLIEAEQEGASKKVAALVLKTYFTSTSAIKSLANIFTKAQTVAPVISNSVTGTYTLDASASNIFRLTFTGDVTFADPINPVDGVTTTIEIIQDGVGSRILTKSAKMKTPSGVGLTLSTAIGAKDLICCTYDGANDIYLCNISKAYS